MSRNTQRMVLTRNFWLQVAETGLLISVNSNKPGLMLKLKLQYFGHLMQRADSQKRPWCCERLKAEGEKGNRGWDGWMASPTQWTWIWANSKRWWGTGKPGLLVHGVTKSLTKLGDWTAKANQWGYNGVPWSLMTWDVEPEIHSTLPLDFLLISLSLETFLPSFSIYGCPK